MLLLAFSYNNDGIFSFKMHFSFYFIIAKVLLHLALSFGYSSLDELLAVVLLHLVLGDWIETFLATKTFKE